MKPSQIVKSSAVVLALATLAASFTAMVPIFLSAYANPEKKWIGTININGSGEANLELFLILASAPCIVYLFCFVLTCLKNEEEKICLIV